MKETFYIATAIFDDFEWIDKEGNWNMIDSSSPITNEYHTDYPTLEDALNAINGNKYGRVLEFSMTPPYKFIAKHYSE